MLRHPAQAVKMAGRDSDPEMSIAAFGVTGLAAPAGTILMVAMPVMMPALVDDLEHGWFETGGKFVDNGLANVHYVWFFDLEK
jgi:hypothetical protein